MQQVFLVLHVVIQGRLLDTQSGGYIAGGGGLVALFPEEIERNLLQPLAGDLTRGRAAIRDCIRRRINLLVEATNGISLLAAPASSDAEREAFTRILMHFVGNPNYLW